MAITNRPMLGFVGNCARSMYQFAPLITLGVVGVIIGGILFLRQLDKERVYYSAFDRDSSSGGADAGYDLMLRILLFFCMYEHLKCVMRRTKERVIGKWQVPWQRICRGALIISLS